LSTYESKFHDASATTRIDAAYVDILCRIITMEAPTDIPLAPPSRNERRRSMVALPPKGKVRASKPLPQLVTEHQAPDNYILSNSTNASPTPSTQSAERPKTIFDTLKSFSRTIKHALPHTPSANLLQVLDNGQSSSSPSPRVSDQSLPTLAEVPSLQSSQVLTSPSLRSSEILPSRHTVQSWAEGSMPQSLPSASANPLVRPKSQDTLKENNSDPALPTQHASM